MLLISILLLISVSINCEDWCPLIQTNGTYKGLGIYKQFYEADIEKYNLVMFNRAGDDWHFKTGKDDYIIEMLNGTLYPKASTGYAYRFSIYFEERGTFSDTHIKVDCTVRNRVNLLIIKLLCIRAVGSALYANIGTWFREQLV